MPWTLPLPTPGAALRLRSGGRLGYELGLDTPSRLARSSPRAPTPARSRTATIRGSRTPTPRSAPGGSAGGNGSSSFRCSASPRRSILFRAHQWIAYGGTFGQYYTYGARPYVLLFLDYWTTITIYLALWAGLWRVIAEIVAWGAARLAPSWATGVRRCVEIACRVAYYGGVPLLLALRFAE